MVKIDERQSITSLFDAILRRALWDYSHRRWSLLKGGPYTIQTASRFLFCDYGRLARAIGYNIPENRVKEKAIATLESKQRRQENKRRIYLKRYMRVVRANEWSMR